MRAGTDVRSRLAWAAVALYLVLVASGLRMHAEMMGIGAADVWVYFSLAWGAIIGALILGRYPRHPIGWLFIAVALSFALSLFSSGYALEAIVFNPDTLPGGEFASWVSFWIEMPGIAVVSLLLPLLFPDGHLPSRRWRPVALGATGLLIIAVVAVMFTPDAYSEYPNITNPLGIAAWRGALQVVNDASTIGLVVLVLLTAAAVWDRRRRATPEVRLQLRWFTFAMAMIFVSFVFELLRAISPVFNTAEQITAIVAITALPTATGIAILRYRLYDIDIIINRTVVYVGLTAVLAGVYTAAVALFQRLFVAVTGQSSDIAIVLTLFVLATVFTPIKNTLQSNADRYLRPVNTSATSITIDDLERLAALHSRGILTDEEFTAKKKQVLGI